MKKSFALTLFVCAAMAAGCRPDPDAADPEPLTEAQAAEASTTLSASVVGVAAAFENAGLGNLVTPARMAEPAWQRLIWQYVDIPVRPHFSRPEEEDFVTCDSGSATVTGNGTDADEDGFPDDLSATFDSCVITSNEEEEQQQATAVTTITLDGALTLRDDDTTQASLDFTMTTTEFAVSWDMSEEGSFAFTRDGSILASQADGYSIVYDFEQTVTGNYGEVEYDYSADWDWATTYDPETDWSVGEALVDGSLSLSGSWSMTWGDDSSASMALETEPALHVAGDCGSRYDDGSLNASWATTDGTADLVMVWTDCGVYTATYNGTAL